ncbi:MAG: sulfotransferase [Nitrospirota bacterium]|nr:sulfotransferase [Nitrospirota bacterium]
MMKMLETGGLIPFTDNIRKADEDNPRGYYELERVKQLGKADNEWLVDAQGKVVKIISAFLQHLPSIYVYRIIFMQRAMQEILASQKKMLINRREDLDTTGDREMAVIYQKHLRQVDQWLRNQPNIRKIDINYNDLVQNPDKYVPSINKFLGNILNTREMVSVIDPRLYRQRLEPGIEKIRTDT